MQKKKKMNFKKISSLKVSCILFYIIRVHKERQGKAKKGNELETILKKLTTNS